MEELNQLQEQKGTVTFANEVLATIAGIAACDIPGVAGMSGGIKDGIASMLGRKNFTKGVKVTANADIVSVMVQIIMEYGSRAPEVCANLRESVCRALETMTGLTVKSVDIAVQGIKFKELELEGESEIPLLED